VHFLCVVLERKREVSDECADASPRTSARKESPRESGRPDGALRFSNEAVEASWKRRRGVGSRRGGDVRHDQVELIIVREVADDAVRHARGFVCLLVSTRGRRRQIAGMAVREQTTKSAR